MTNFSARSSHLESSTCGRSRRVFLNADEGLVDRTKYQLLDGSTSDGKWKSFREVSCSQPRPALNNVRDADLPRYPAKFYFSRSQFAMARGSNLTQVPILNDGILPAFACLKIVIFETPAIWQAFRPSAFSFSRQNS